MKTTISGLLAALSSFLGVLAIMPRELQEQIPQLFPEQYRGQVGVILLLVAFFARSYQAKNTADSPSSKSSIEIPPKVIVAVGLLSLYAVTGCAFYRLHKPQIKAVGQVALDHIAKSAFQIAAKTLSTELNTGFTADIGYELQANARASLPDIVSSDSLRDYLQAWNNTATAQFAALVPPNLSAPAAQQVALVIADSQAAAIPAAAK